MQSTFNIKSKDHITSSYQGKPQPLSFKRTITYTYTNTSSTWEQVFMHVFALNFTRSHWKSRFLCTQLLNQLGSISTVLLMAELLLTPITPMHSRQEKTQLISFSYKHPVSPSWSVFHSETRTSSGRNNSLQGRLWTSKASWDRWLDLNCPTLDWSKPKWEFHAPLHGSCGRSRQPWQSSSNKPPVNSSAQWAQLSTPTKQLGQAKNNVRRP